MGANHSVMLRQTFTHLNQLISYILYIMQLSTRFHGKNLGSKVIVSTDSFVQLTISTWISFPQPALPCSARMLARARNGKYYDDPRYGQLVHTLATPLSSECSNTLSVIRLLSRCLAFEHLCPICFVADK
jgi:hypothetical protein